MDRKINPVVARMVNKVGKRPKSEDEKYRSSKEERGDDSKDPVKVVSLRGLGVTEGGDLVDRNFFVAMSDHLTNYNDRMLTREDAIKLQRKMIAYSTGAASVAPLTCFGGECPMSHVCPFINEDITGGPPLTHPCPIELDMMRVKKKAYIDEYRVSLESPTELSFIDELVRIEIFEWRLTGQLSKPRDSALVSEEVIGLDKDEDPIMTRKISPVLEALDRLASRKTKVVQAMVGDRREKYKKQSSIGERGDDASTHLADIAEIAQKLLAAKDGGAVKEDLEAIAKSILAKKVG